MCNFLSVVMDKEGKKIYAGNLTSHSETAKLFKLKPDEYVEVEWTCETEEFLNVHQGATFTTPVLAKVDGSVYLHQGATFTTPVLAKVDGSVYLHQGATFTAPVLAQ